MTRPDVLACCDDVIELADDLAKDKAAWDGCDLDDLVGLLAKVEDAKKAAAAVYGMVERATLAALKAADAKQYLCEAGAVERHGQRKSIRWDAKLLLGNVVAVALDRDRIVDVETGDAEPREDCVQRALTDCYGLALPSVRPRIGWLKDHGIDPDDYSTWEWGAPKLELHRPSREHVAEVTS